MTSTTVATAVKFNGPTKSAIYGLQLSGDFADTVGMDTTPTDEQIQKMIAREAHCRAYAKNHRGNFAANYTKEANRLAKRIAEIKRPITGGSSARA